MEQPQDTPNSSALDAAAAIAYSNAKKSAFKSRTRSIKNLILYHGVWLPITLPFLHFFKKYLITNCKSSWKDVDDCQKCNTGMKDHICNTVKCSEGVGYDDCIKLPNFVTFMMFVLSAIAIYNYLIWHRTERAAVEELISKIFKHVKQKSENHEEPVSVSELQKILIRKKLLLRTEHHWYDAVYEIREYSVFKLNNAKFEQKLVNGKFVETIDYQERKKTVGKKPGDVVTECSSSDIVESYSSFE